MRTLRTFMPRPPRGCTPFACCGVLGWRTPTLCACIFTLLIRSMLEYACLFWQTVLPRTLPESWQVRRGGLSESPSQTVRTLMRRCSCPVFLHYTTAAMNSAGAFSEPYCPLHTNFIIYCRHRRRTDMTSEGSMTMLLPCANTSAMHKLSFLTD